MQQVYILDRAAYDRATELHSHLGESAGLEAAAQASRSRDLGNLIHFCRWREIERVLDIFADDGAESTLH